LCTNKCYKKYVLSYNTITITCFMDKKASFWKQLSHQLFNLFTVMSVCLSFRPFVITSISLADHLSNSASYFSIWLSFCPSIHSFVCFSVSHPVNLSLCWSSIHPFVALSSVYLSVHLSVCCLSSTSIFTLFFNNNVS
jgi:hypothetical protein